MNMNGMDLEEMNGRIIECSFNKETDTWVYMRERKDKDLPNAFHVFLKVQQSIRDNITEDILEEHITAAVREPIYANDLNR